MPRAAATLLAPVLLILTAGAFAAAEALKLRTPPLAIPDDGFLAADPFSPRVGPAEIRLTVRKRAALLAEIVTPGGELVRRIAERPSAQGPQRLRWDGRTADGRRAPDAEYRLRLRLGDRTFDLPNRILVDTEPPQVTAALSRDVISPDGDGRRDAAFVRYRSSEPVRRPADLPRWARGDETPAIRLQLVGPAGERSYAYKPRRTGRLRVPATPDGRPAPGTYAGTLLVADRAGNVADVPLGRLRSRYVDLVPPDTAVPAGLPAAVTVDADVPRVRYEARRDGEVVARGRVRAGRLELRTGPGRRGGVLLLRARYAVGPPGQDRRYLGEAVVAVRGRPPADVAVVLPERPDLDALEGWLATLAGDRYDGLTPEDARSAELLTGYGTIRLAPGARLDDATRTVLRTAGVRVVEAVAS